MLCKSKLPQITVLITKLNISSFKGRASKKSLHLTNTGDLTSSAHPKYFLERMALMCCNKISGVIRPLAVSADPITIHRFAKEGLSLSFKIQDYEFLGLQRLLPDMEPAPRHNLTRREENQCQGFLKSQLQTDMPALRVPPYHKPVKKSVTTLFCGAFWKCYVERASHACSSLIIELFTE